MNMRRYSMKARRVTALKRLLRNDRVRIQRITIAAHEKKEDMVYIFFDNVEEETQKDRIALDKLKAKVELIANGSIYPKLTNAKQRELFLLDRYGLSKRESADMVELLKIAEIAASVAMDEKQLTTAVKQKVKEEKEG